MAVKLCDEISDKDRIEGILRIKENPDVTDLWESYSGHNKNICNNGEVERLTKERNQLKTILFAVLNSRIRKLLEYYRIIKKFVLTR